MKRLTLTVLLSCTTYALLASTSAKSASKGVCGESLNSAGHEQMKTLFQCGVGTERGFEGWKLNGLSHETITWFEKDHIELFQHNPGNYSIGFEKKIEDMVGYTDLRLSADIDAIENCLVNYATAYVSRDGKTWIPLQKDVRTGSDIYAEKMEYMFVKVVADITFFQEGRFRMNRLAVYGDYNKRSKKTPLSTGVVSTKNNLTPVSYGPAAIQMKDEFFVFTYDKRINVETRNEKDYEFVLSNLLGQVVFKEKSKGSRRFVADVPAGIYFVTIIQDDKLITTKKVVL
ncbi:MAG: T9SS type A sorting domain-containing protein [Crocinitomicaceae bacterium]|nr:T9SS type A sorting domain-containing protein [Crocinitomicaceae bacterium]